jgi:hypothetical protein
VGDRRTIAGNPSQRVRYGGSDDHLSTWYDEGGTTGEMTSLPCNRISLSKVLSLVRIVNRICTWLQALASPKARDSGVELCCVGDPRTVIGASRETGTAGHTKFENM